MHVEAELQHGLLGSTMDDAAGECFDKVGKLIGLPYPAGPHIDRLALEGNPEAFKFPRPMLQEANDDFSFSGLKTSVRYFLRDHPLLLEDGPALRDLCASVQAAIVEVLVTKTVRAAKRLRVACVTASGGVTCNGALRRQLAAACVREGLRLRLAEPGLCTDNAAMIGVLAERKLMRKEEPTPLSADLAPDWTLVGISSPLYRAPLAADGSPSKARGHREGKRLHHPAYRAGGPWRRSISSVAFSTGLRLRLAWRMAISAIMASGLS